LLAVSTDEIYNRKYKNKERNKLRDNIFVLEGRKRCKFF